MDCIECGTDNKSNATFCKKCGSDLKDKNIIYRLNSQINILAVFIGLIISILVLFSCSVLFSGFLVSKTLPLPIYVIIVLMTMTFFGSILTGALGCKNVNIGFVNGGFLSLFVLILAGLIIGFIFFAIMGISAVLASAFGPTAGSLGSGTATSSLGSGATSGVLSSLNSTSSSSGNSIFDLVLYVIEFIAGLLFIIVSGMLGGALGVYIKNGFKRF